MTDSVEQVKLPRIDFNLAAATDRRSSVSASHQEESFMRARRRPLRALIFVAGSLAVLPSISAETYSVSSDLVSAAAGTVGEVAGVFVGAFGGGAPGSTEQVVVTPTGVFAEIETGLALGSIEALASDDEDWRAKTIAAIRAHPESYAPPVFYVLSHALFADGEKDEAAFWFYAGQLRAGSDANRCAEIAARQAVGALNNLFGSLIKQHAFQDIPKLEVLIPRVVEWDRKTARNYDHRWINLHGLEVFLLAHDPDSPVRPLSLPEDQWEATAETTRVEYLEGFQKAMVGLKRRSSQ